MNREYTLHAFALNNASHGKSLFETTAVSGNYHAAKNLNTFFVALNNLYRYVHLIANGKMRRCFFHLFFFNHIDNIHNPYLLFLMYKFIIKSVYILFKRSGLFSKVLSMARFLCHSFIF